MMMKRSFLSVFSALALSAILLVSFAGSRILVLAEDTDTDAVQALVLRSNTPFYLKNGEKVFYEENSGYYPETKNGELMVPIDLASKMLDFSYTYSSSRETAEITKDDITLSIRAGEDGLFINGNGKYLTNYAVNTDDRFLLPMNAVSEGLGFNVYKKVDDQLTVITKAAESEITESVLSDIQRKMINDDNVLYEDSFGGSTWNYQAWNGGSADTDPSADDGNGGTAAYVGATQTGFLGLMSKEFEYNEALSYKVTADIKTTSDWKNQTFDIAFWEYSSTGSFISPRYFKNVTAPITDEWQTYTFVFSKYDIRADLDDKDAGKFYILLRTAKSGSDAAAGGVYVDNLTLETYSPTDEYVNCDFVADKEMAWYYKGDTVTYTTKNPQALAPYDNIKVTVYDRDSNVITSNMCETYKIMEDGWSWMPPDVGYYEVGFEAVSKDGTSRPIAKTYSYTVSSENGVYDLEGMAQERCQFAVVKGAAKPMEERSEMIMASIPPSYDAVEFKKLDLLGTKGLRLHYFLWGDAWGSSNGIEKSPGTYDFTASDKNVELIKEMGFSPIIGNTLSTPKFYVEEEYQDEAKYGSQLYSRLGPEDVTVLGDYIKEFYNHYKDFVDILEFWNEPHYGNTAFWADTPEKLKEMTKTAYAALREVDPEGNMKLAAHGWNQGYQLYGEVIEDKEYFDSFDILTYHSKTGYDIANYRSYDEALGYESKPAIATEEYLSAEYEQGVPKDKMRNAAIFVLKWLSHVDAGVTSICDFEQSDNIPDEVRVFLTSNNMGASHVMGKFSKFPYHEPHVTAVTAYNWYDKVGKEFTIEKQFDLGNGQKGVYCLTDGEPLVVVWNSEDNGRPLSDTIKNAAADSGLVFTDYEGKTVDPASGLDFKVIYYAEGLDKAKLDALPDSDGAALNPLFEDPIYECVLPEDKIDEAPSLADSGAELIADSSAEAPFDKDTFAEADNIEWHDAPDEWTWVEGTHAKPADYGAKFAVHVDADGMYLMVDVTDSKYVGPDDLGATFAQYMYEGDSLQFAYDTQNMGDAEQRAEYQVGIFEGEPTIFKQFAPDVGFNMIDGFHGNSTELDAEDTLRIEQTDTGIRYKIFIPSGDLYPFRYSEDSEYLRFSLLLNNNDGNGRSYYEWSSGIGADKDLSLYGAIRFRSGNTE